MLICINVSPCISYDICLFYWLQKIRTIIMSPMNLSSDTDFKPRIGMKFDSLDDGWMFWVQYGGKVGFGVRKHYFNKSKKIGQITSYKYVCCKEGVRKEDKRDSLTANPRLEPRANCKVRLGVTYVNSIYKVKEFKEEHNHPLHLPETMHMLSSLRRIMEVQAHEIDRWCWAQSEIIFWFDDQTSLGKRWNWLHYLWR